MSAPRFKSWERIEELMQEAADKQGEKLFVHPGDKIDARERGDLEGAGELAEQSPAADALGAIFVRMMAVCLPPRSYGDERRWKAGYHRMVAFTWRFAPEMFEGATRAEVAARLGITLRAFGKQLAYVDAILSGRVPPSLQKQDADGDDDAE